MSWPLNYDPASHSISFGGRDRSLYPNGLAPFDQAALVAGYVTRTYCDRDSERRSRPGNEHLEVGDGKFEDKNAKGNGSEEDRCAFDTTLDKTTSISYTKPDQPEVSRQKQKRFVESLARGKWKRYRRQYTSNISDEAHITTDSLPTHGHTSTFPKTLTNMPYLTLPEARHAALNNQAARELGLKTRTIEGGKWSSVSLLADPAAFILTTGTGPAIVDTDLWMSEARLSAIPERWYSPQSSMEEKRALVVATTSAPKEQSVDKHQNKETTLEPNIIHTTQNFLQHLLHPHENIIKPALQLATKLLCFQHTSKIQQPEKQAQAWDVDIEKNVPLSKRDVKKWRARRGYHRPLFSWKLVQSVAKIVEKDGGEWRWGWR